MMNSRLVPFSMLLHILIAYLACNITPTQSIAFNITSLTCVAKENTLTANWKIIPNIKFYDFDADPPAHKTSKKPFPIIGFIVEWFSVQYATITDNNADIFKDAIVEKTKRVKGMAVASTLWEVYEKNSDFLKAVKSASKYISSFEYRALRPTSQQYYLDELPFGHEYFIEVRALLRDTVSATAIVGLNASCLVKTEEGVPSKPEKFKVSIQDKTSVRLSWTRPFKAKGSIQSYKVEYQMIGDEKLQEIELGKAARNVRIGNLTAYRMYNFRMVARNSALTGKYTPWIKLRLQPRQFKLRIRFPELWKSKNPSAPEYYEEEKFEEFLDASFMNIFMATSYKYLGIEMVSSENITIRDKEFYEVVSYLYFDKNGLARADAIHSFVKNAITAPPLTPARASIVTEVNFCGVKRLNVCHEKATCTSEHGLFTCKCNLKMIDDSKRQNMLPGIECLANTEVPIDVMTKAINPTTAYLAWGLPKSSVGKISHYDIEGETLVDGKPVLNMAKAQPGGFFTEYEFKDLPAYGLHKFRVRAVTETGAGEWTDWSQLRTVTSVFSVVFDFTSTEPVPNYQQIRQQVHDDVTEAVRTELTKVRELDFRDFRILMSDIVGQNEIRITAVIYVGREWEDGSILIETRIMEEFKDTVKIPGGPITEDSIKVSDYNECGTDFEDCSGTICKNKLGSFTCHCPYAHVDVSEDYGLLPGRKCIIFDAPGSFLGQVLNPKAIRVSWTIPHLLRNEQYKFWFALQYKRRVEDPETEIKIEVKDANFTHEGYVMTKEIRNLIMNSKYMFRAAAANTFGVGRFSTWVEAKTTASIFEAKLNLTSLHYKRDFDNPKSEKTKETKQGIRSFLDRVMISKMAQYKNSGSVRIIPGIKKRSYALVLMFFDASSYVDPLQVSDMFKYNIQSDNPYGLDFTSVEIGDFNECNTTWSDCSINGHCENAAPSYKCKCRDGYVDNGGNTGRLPGRVCVSRYATTTTKATTTMTTTQSTHQTHKSQNQNNPITTTGITTTPTTTRSTTTTTTTTTTGTTTTTPMPDPGVELKGFAISLNKLLVVWKRYSIQSTNINDLNYVIQYCIKGTQNWKELIVPAKIPSLTITDLRPNLSYRIRVAEKWRTNTERHTEYTFPIEVRTSPRAFRMFTQLPDVLPDDLVTPSTSFYRKMQDFVIDYVNDIFTSTYMKSRYQQIKFGSADKVVFQPYIDRGTSATFLLYLLPNSAGNAPLIKTAYEDTDPIVESAKDMKLIGVADFDECSSADSNDCDSNAQCTNVEGSYHCVCGAGYTDVSDKYFLLRGRVCEGRGTTTTTTTTMATTTTRPRPEETQNQNQNEFQPNNNNKGFVYSDKDQNNIYNNRPSNTQATTTTRRYATRRYTTTTIRARTTTRRTYPMQTPYPPPPSDQDNSIFQQSSPSYQLSRSGASSFSNSQFGSVAVPCIGGFEFSNGICIDVERYIGVTIVNEKDGKDIKYIPKIEDELKTPVEEALNQVFGKSRIVGFDSVQLRGFSRSKIPKKNGVRVEFLLKLEKTNTNTPPPNLFNRNKRQTQSPAYELLKRAFEGSLKKMGSNGIVQVSGSSVRFDTTLGVTRFADYNECTNQAKDTDCETKSSSCRNLPGSYTCKCRAFFTDVSPDPTRPGRKCLDQCHVNPCQNGGTCKQRLGLEPRCVCRSGYTGGKCETAQKGANLILIGVVVGVIALVVFIMCSTVCFVRFRKKQIAKRKAKSEDDSSSDDSDDDKSSDDSDIEKKGKKKKKKRPKFITEENTQPKDAKDIKYIQPSRQQNENNTEPSPPKRPPKPPSYSSNDSPVKEYGALPPVPPKKNYLTKINGDSDQPPPVPKHKFHQTTMKHEDLHSRPPALPPRSTSSDESLNDYAPPALPPKSSKFS